MLPAIMALALADSIPLWPDGFPDGWTSPREEATRDSGSGRELLEHVAVPRLLPYPVERQGPVVVIIPGGGYHILAWEHEGKDVARFLSQRGFSAYVLLHRLPEPRGLESGRTPCLQDAERALEIVRGRHPGQKAGLVGFSAGGHLSAWTAAQSGAKPDFLALIYAAYLSDGPQIRPDVAPMADAPPAFLVHTMDDGIPVDGPLSFIAAMRVAGRPVEAHIYPKGGHGYGLQSPEPGLRDWGLRLAEWLEALPNSL
jgi:acetyl esterase/lipase